MSGWDGSMKEVRGIEEACGFKLCCSLQKRLNKNILYDIKLQVVRRNIFNVSVIFNREFIINVTLSWTRDRGPNVNRHVGLKPLDLAWKPSTSGINEHLGQEGFLS